MQRINLYLAKYRSHIYTYTHIREQSTGKKYREETANDKLPLTETMHSNTNTQDVYRKRTHSNAKWNLGTFLDNTHCKCSMQICAKDDKTQSNRRHTSSHFFNTFEKRERKKITNRTRARSNTHNGIYRECVLPCVVWPVTKFFTHMCIVHTRSL